MQESTDVGIMAGMPCRNLLLAPTLSRALNFQKFPPFEELMKCVSSGQLLDARRDGWRDRMRRGKWSEGADGRGRNGGKLPLASPCVSKIKRT